MELPPHGYSSHVAHPVFFEKSEARQIIEPETLTLLAVKKLVKRIGAHTLTLPAVEPTVSMDTMAPVFVSHLFFIKLFCKSRFPHKSVNLSLVIINIKNRLTDWCGN